jgi:hypothetical protein
MKSKGEDITSLSLIFSATLELSFASVIRIYTPSLSQLLLPTPHSPFSS